MIEFTSDIDWAPDIAIDYMLSLFEKYSVKCTLFATHKTNELSLCNRGLFEIGIHPNFNPVLQGFSKSSFNEIISDLLAIYPEAKGIRSHSLTHSSVFYQIFIDLNLSYDSNQFIPYCKLIDPYKLWNNFIRIPFNWEDDVHIAYRHSCNDLAFNTEIEAKIIANFHPIHIFLNTEDENRYIDAKPFFNNPNQLKKMVNNSGKKGIRDLFIELLKDVSEKKILTNNLINIAKKI